MQFVIRHDAPARFRFASLQSEAGQRLRAEHGVTVDSVVLIEDGRAYLESEAALRIASDLGAPWSWLRFAKVVPAKWRNVVYRQVARHRYQWFGKREVCWLPTPELSSRFLT